jgi:hypothetical protein
LHAPTEPWEKLDNNTKKNLIEALRSSRVIQPAFSNCLLFSATIEAFLCFVGDQWIVKIWNGEDTPDLRIVASQAFAIVHNNRKS